MSSARPQNRHLIPFKPGAEGAANATGRPRNAPVVTPRIRYYSSWSLRRLAALLAEHEDDLPIADVIAIGILLKAGKDVALGDKARDVVLDRLDGKQASGMAVDAEPQII